MWRNVRRERAREKRRKEVKNYGDGNVRKSEEISIKAELGQMWSKGRL